MRRENHKFQNTTQKLINVLYLLVLAGKYNIARNKENNPKNDDVSYLEETEHNLKLFEEKLKKFQENSRVYNNQQQTDEKYAPLNFNSNQPGDSINISNYNSNRKEVLSTNNQYKLTDKLSEKRRLYKAHGSSNNIVLNDDNTSAKEKLNNEVVIDKLSFSKLEEENKSLKKKIDEMNNSIKNKDKSKEESDNDLKNKISILLQEKKDLNLIISVIFKLI